MARERFPDLRGLRWRIGLGVLPANAAVNDLRRVAADNRRKYARLRRRHQVDPHFAKDEERSVNLSVDNPLSQNPDSTWGQFFKNAELEKVIDQDLQRLSPDSSSYFQSSEYRNMSRRILVLWCLLHPEYGHRQGMHELLAPLLYVLRADLNHLSLVQTRHKDYFNGDLDGVSFLERDPASCSKLSCDSDTKFCKLDELDSDTRDILLLTDSYGTEGELGVVVSERFMEHDAYCMFDGLMKGASGVVAMADFFQSTGTLLPANEASSALYHLLSIVDSSLHCHLVELDVEPQYFGLRWLRLLFGREFCLDDLLVIWDEIFSAPNAAEKGCEYGFKILSSPRGAFIAALAVSMLRHIRSSLLATETTTSCLQRLLNFPTNPDMKKLIEKAKDYQVIVMNSNISPLSPDSNNKATISRRYSLPSGLVCPKTPVKSAQESYWEEQWQMSQAEEAAKKVNCEPQSSAKTKKFWGGRLGLSRTASDPSPAIEGPTNNARTSVSRKLFDDSSRNIKSERDEVLTVPDETEHPGSEANDIGDCIEESSDRNFVEVLGKEISSTFSTPASPRSTIDEDRNGLDKVSVTSSSSVCDNEEETAKQESCIQSSDNQPVQVSEDQLPFGGKFHWLWKLTRGAGEGNSGKPESRDPENTVTAQEVDKDDRSMTVSDGSKKIDVVDKNVFSTFKTLGQSMLENIQVIETVFQQDRGQSGSLENQSKSILGGKGQVTATSALKELRKISSLLREM